MASPLFFYSLINKKYFYAQKNQLDDSWFLLYLQNYIHVDISLRINFLRCRLSIVLRGGHFVTSSLSVICFANVQSVSGMLLHKQACSESFLLHPAASSASWSSPHPISNSQLHALLHFHLCPIYLVVFKGVYFFRMGYLILRGASRLDAFSVYPFRAWLLGRRLGSLTDAPAARPSRSSRTKDSSSQISYAHAG